MGIFNITLNAGGIIKLIKKYFQHLRRNDGVVDQRKYERRYKIEKRSQSELNQKRRLVCGFRLRVYLEFRKGDQELLDLTYSNYARLENVISTYFGDQRFKSRNVGCHVHSRKVVDYAINAVRKQMIVDRVDYSRIGIIVDKVINAIWTKYLVNISERREKERRKLPLQKISTWRELDYDSLVPV